MRDGGPAFPALPSATEGMSLLDKFADSAMMALIIAAALRDDKSVVSEDSIAEESYEMAKAMLARRSK